MHIIDAREIGNRLLAIRKKAGMTQMEVAEAADLSHRTYADIERGTSNMRVDTVLKICNALHIMPNEILASETKETASQQKNLLKRLNDCTQKERETALQLLEVYLHSIK